jgi:hypothetical protein
MTKPAPAVSGKSSGVQGKPGIFVRFSGNTACRALLCLGILSLLALLDYRRSGLTRTTLVFYSIETGSELIEERMLPLPRDQEEKIKFYIAETLLGSALRDALPLFPRDTQLESILFRDGVVYANISETAALPAEGGDNFRSLSTLRGGILRNFRFVKDVRLFIAGNEAFPGKFRLPDGETKKQ